MSDLADALTTKIGPLPSWAWGLGVGGALVGWRFWRDRNTPSDAEKGEASPVAPSVIQDGNEVFELSPISPGGFPVYRPAGDGTLSVEDDAPDTSSGAITTNADWRLAVVRWSLVSGGYSPLTVEAAVSKYLDGEPITDAEALIINEAIRAIGPAPQGAPAITVVAQPSGVAPVPTPQNPDPTPTPTLSPPPRIPDIDYTEAKPKPKPKPDIVVRVDGSKAVWKLLRDAMGSTYSQATYDKVLAYNGITDRGASGIGDDVAVGSTIKVPGELVG